MGTTLAGPVEREAPNPQQTIGFSRSAPISATTAKDGHSAGTTTSAHVEVT
jgi:hypothetical protein